MLLTLQLLKSRPAYSAAIIKPQLNDSYRIDRNVAPETLNISYLHFRIVTGVVGRVT